jgi:hypothetical protein
MEWNMFTDQEVSVKDVGTVLSKLSDLGLKSVASYLSFKPVVVESLADRNLMNVVLEEISRRDPGETCMLRSYNDTPVGIPKGTTAIELNEFLDTHVEHLDILEHPFTKTVYQRKIDTDIELIQNDTYKLNYSAWINILAGKVEQRIDLMRMFCSNKSYLTDKSFIEKTSISGFDPLFEKFHEKRDRIIEQVRRSLALLTARKTNVMDLKVLSNTAETLQSIDLRAYLRAARIKILQAYELPMFLPRGFGGEANEEDYSIDLFKLPKSWKRTAILEDTTVYDLWNVMTKEVSKFELHRLLDVDTILKAHVNVTKILQPIKSDEDIIAKKRTSAQL